MPNDLIDQAHFIRYQVDLNAFLLKKHLND